MGPDQDRSAMFILADKVLDGQLETKLRQWRAAGVSLRSIQALLELELEVRPALETVRRWCQHLQPGDNGENEAA